MAVSLQMTIRYETGEDGWVVASVPEVPDAMSQGRTRLEARTNVIDALALMLAPEDDPGHDAEALERQLGVPPPSGSR